MFMKIIVTGASGFIGTNLVKYLKNKKMHVIAVCDHTCESSDIADEAIFTGLIGLKSKYLLTKTADAMIHMAANNDTLSEDTEQMIRHNYLSSKKMLKLAKNLNCSRFVYTSCIAVYGNKKDQEDPLNIYATSKLMFDNFIKDTTGFNGEKDMTIVGLRLCNVYGPYECIKERRMSFLGRMLRNMILNKTIDLFEETGNKRDWVYVEDVCEAIFKSLQASKHGIYNIGSGSTISFIDLFEKLARITNYKNEPKLIKNKNIKSYQNIETNDISLAISDLGYKPKYNLDKGIEKYYKEIKENYPAIS